jgi:tetratricopeptide (TPR) repeat protein
MVRLSFCAIVKNEAHNLDRCLASVKPYVDELIVVDTGSTDNTVAIAQRYGAKVSHFEWCNDFAAARNDSIARASGEWILTLDADEELVVQSQDWVAQLQNGATNLIKGFEIELRSSTASETQMQALRLFQNYAEMQYCGKYHEHLTYAEQALQANPSNIQPLQGVEIIHYGYAEDVIVGKSIQRLPMLEHLRATEGLSLMLLWTLSGMYQVTEHFDEVHECYEEAWERLLPHLLTNEQPEDTCSVRSWLYSLAVRSLKAEDVETSHFICEQGMEWFPDFPPLFYLNGTIRKLFGASDESIPYFEHCIKAGQTGNYSKSEPFDQALITVYPAFDVGTVYLEHHRQEEAIAAFTLALSFDPNHAQAQEQLAIAHEHLYANQ